MGDRGYLFGLAGLAAAYVMLAGWVPPADDELYYWCWSRDLRPSYFDHPPMTAYLVRASTEVFGHSLVAVRLPACLASVAVLGVIGWLTRPRQVLAWVVLSPLYTFGAVLVTPDTPLLLFWAGYLGWLVVVHRRLDGGRVVPVGLWAGGGVLLGCAGLSKYTAVLAGPAGFLSFVLAGRPWREWVPGYVFHGAVAFALVLPVLAFNVAHDFAPLRFQWDHVTSAGGGVGPFAEFVGAQVLLFGLLPLALFPWVVWNARTLAADPRLRACACLYAVPMGFFLYKAARGPLEGNWALASYIGFWPLAAHWFEAARGSATIRWLAAGSFAVPVACVLLLATHMVEPLAVVGPDQDRVARHAAKAEAARAVAAAVRRHGEPLPVFAPTYQLTAHLRYQGIAAQQLDGASRPSHFTLRPHRLTDVARAYVVTEGPLPAELTPGFGPPEAVASVPVVVRGRDVTVYHLLLFTRSAAREPCGNRRDVAAGSLTGRAAVPTLTPQVRP